MWVDAVNSFGPLISVAIVGGLAGSVICFTVSLIILRGLKMIGLPRYIITTITRTE